MLAERSMEGRLDCRHGVAALDWQVIACDDFEGCFWNDFTKLKPGAGPATTPPLRKFGPAANVLTGSGTYSPKSKASGVHRRRAPAPSGISAKLAHTCVIQSC